MPITYSILELTEVLSAGFMHIWLPVRAEWYLCGTYFGRRRERACFDQILSGAHWGFSICYSSLPGILFLKIRTSNPPHFLKSLLRHFLLRQVLPAYSTLNFHPQLIPHCPHHSSLSPWPFQPSDILQSLTHLVSTPSHYKLGLWR